MIRPPVGLSADGALGGAVVLPRPAFTAGAAVGVADLPGSTIVAVHAGAALAPLIQIANGAAKVVTPLIGVGLAHIAAPTVTIGAFSPISAPVCALTTVVAPSALVIIADGGAALEATALVVVDITLGALPLFGADELALATLLLDAVAVVVWSIARAAHIIFTNRPLTAAPGVGLCVAADAGAIGPADQDLAAFVVVVAAAALAGAPRTDGTDRQERVCAALIGPGETKNTGAGPLIADGGAHSAAGVHGVGNTFTAPASAA